MTAPFLPPQTAPARALTPSCAEDRTLLDGSVARQRERLLELLQHLATSVEVTASQMQAGFERVFANLDDLALDNPNAAVALSAYVVAPSKRPDPVPALTEVALANGPAGCAFTTRPGSWTAPLRSPSCRPRPRATCPSAAVDAASCRRRPPKGIRFSQARRAAHKAARILGPLSSVCRLGRTQPPPPPLNRRALPSPPPCPPCPLVFRKAPAVPTHDGR